MKKLLIYLFTLSISIVCHAYDFKVGEICYNILSTADMTAEVTYYKYVIDEKNGYGGENGILTIPETVSYEGLTFNVVRIGDHACYGSGCKTIVIPDCITSLGKGCFEYSNIKYITIPGSIKILPERALCSCYELEEVNLSEGLEIIEHEALYATTLLKHLTIPSTVKQIEGLAASFERYDYIISKAAIAPSLGDKSNLGKVKKLVIPEGSLQSYIDAKWGFNSYLEYDTTIQDIVVDFSKDYYDFEVTKLTEGKREVSIINYSQHLFDIYQADRVLPDTIHYNGIKYDIVSIGERAFEDALFQKIHIPGSIKTIGQYAFTNNTLNYVILDEGVSFIDDYAFDRCSLITSIVIPASIDSLGSSVFSGCSYLKNVYSLSTVPKPISDKAFNGITNLQGTLYVPVGTKDLYQATAGWKEFQTIVETVDLRPELYVVTYIIQGPGIIKTSMNKVTEGTTTELYAKDAVIDLIITPISDNVIDSITINTTDIIDDIQLDENSVLLGQFDYHYTIKRITEDIILYLKVVSKESHNGVDGISCSENTNDAIYNLNGIKVNGANLQNGIYIQNGKLILR